VNLTFLSHEQSGLRTSFGAAALGNFREMSTSQKFPQTHAGRRSLASAPSHGDLGPMVGPRSEAHASRDATTGQMPRKLNTTLLFYTQDLDGFCTLHTLHMTVTIRSQLLTPSFNKKYQDASNACHKCHPH